MSRAYQLRMADRRYKELLRQERDRNMSAISRKIRTIAALVFLIPFFWAAFMTALPFGIAFTAVILLGVFRDKTN